MWNISFLFFIWNYFYSFYFYVKINYCLLLFIYLFIYLFKTFTIIQQFSGQYFIWKKLLILFRKDALNWSKVTIKTLIIKWYHAVLFNFLFIKESWKNVSTFNMVFYRNMEQHNCFQHIVEHIIFWLAHQYIRMISEGSCGTGVMMLFMTGINHNLRYIKTEKSLFYYNS